MKTVISWHKRAKLVMSDVSTRRQWWSKCGRYVVERVDFSLASMSRIWRTFFYPDDGRKLWTILGRHKTKAAAIRAAERHSAK